MHPPSGAPRPGPGPSGPPSASRSLPGFDDLESLRPPETEGDDSDADRTHRGLRDRSTLLAIAVVIVLLVGGVGLLGRSGGGSGDTTTATTPSPGSSAPTPDAEMLATGDLQRGDCLRLDGLAGDLGRRYLVPVVPCDQAHNAEVVGGYEYAAGDLPEAADDTVAGWVLFMCAQDFLDQSGQSVNDTQLYLGPLLGISDRLVVCVVSPPDNTSTTERLLPLAPDEATLITPSTSTVSPSAVPAGDSVPNEG